MSQDGLTDGEILKQVRDLVAKGKVVWTGHSEQRIAQYGLAREQITDCLLRGIYEDNPVVPNRTGPLQYSFRMRCRMEGVVIRVAASLYPDSHVVVITVIDPRER